MNRVTVNTYGYVSFLKQSACCVSFVVLESCRHFGLSFGPTLTLIEVETRRWTHYGMVSRSWQLVEGGVIFVQMRRVVVVVGVSGVGLAVEGT